MNYLLQKKGRTMTNAERLELFKKIEVTKKDLVDLVKMGYKYTDEEIEFLTGELGLINIRMVGWFIEYDKRDYLVDLINQTIEAGFRNSRGIVRRQYQNIFERYLDSLDEEETTQKLLNDTDLCEQVMARYEKYLEHCSHADAMYNAIEDLFMEDMQK